jgi:hypothetical protein
LTPHVRTHGVHVSRLTTTHAAAMRRAACERTLPEQTEMGVCVSKPEPAKPATSPPPAAKAPVAAGEADGLAAKQRAEREAVHAPSTGMPGARRGTVVSSSSAAAPASSAGGKSESAAAAKADADTATASVAVAKSAADRDLADKTAAKVRADAAAKDGAAVSAAAQTDAHAKELVRARARVVPSLVPKLRFFTSRGVERPRA